MARPLPAFLARPLIRFWLAFSRHSWQRGVMAADSPHVHAPGMDPDRVLLTGDGVATGRGVRTHDLGLPGYLARSLSARTGHATDVDIVVDESMTVRTCLAALDGTDLFRYDVIVLSLGHNEALALMRPTVWRDQVQALLSELTDRVPVATKIFLLPIPVFGPGTKLPAALATVLDARAQVLDAITLELVEADPRVALLGDGSAYEFEAENSHLYRVWADGIAEQISDDLDPDRARAGSTADVNEERRAAAVACSPAASVVADPVLDDLTRQARKVFGTDRAVITLIHSDVQTMISTSGTDPIVIPRGESFCDITIRRATHLVVEDAALDARYNQLPTVTGDRAVRFYAGYPIEARDGLRIGAFCIMDSEPRRFSPSEVALLRKLAQQAQQHLWALPDTS